MLVQAGAIQKVHIVVFVDNSANNWVASSAVTR